MFDPFELGEYIDRLFAAQLHTECAVDHALLDGHVEMRFKHFAGVYARRAEREVTCLVCKRSFHSAEPNARYCGPRCKDEQRHRLDRERRRAHPSRLAKTAPVMAANDDAADTGADLGTEASRRLALVRHLTKTGMRDRAFGRRQGRHTKSY
jgi:hypothetical protein